MPIVREFDIIGTSPRPAPGLGYGQEPSSTSTESRPFAADVVAPAGKFVAYVTKRLGSDVSQGVWSSGIEKTPGVCGGAARIAGTRIPVWTLARFRQLGASEEDLIAFYPVLTRDKLARVWEYASKHPDEIAGEILQNEV